MDALAGVLMGKVQIINYMSCLVILLRKYIIKNTNVFALLTMHLGSLLMPEKNKAKCVTSN